MASGPFVRLSVRSSVTLRYCGHSVSSKIITHIVRLGSLLSAVPNNINLLQGEHPQISGGLGVEYGKVVV